MRDYFFLQYRIINRHLSDFGIPPLVGYLLAVLLFAGTTTYLWFASSYAPYVYALIGTGLTTFLSDPGRINFIRQHFSKQDFQRIRAVENSIVFFPFAIVLLISGEWLLGLAVIVTGMLLSLTSVNNSFSIALPTPFSRYPFEFAVGFRKNLPVLLFAAFLLVMAILYTNANLGFFAVALVMLVCLGFYMSSEPAYLVWVHQMTPAAFLWHKIRLAVWNATILVLPFATVFVFAFPGHAVYLLILYPLGLLYMITALLGKYAFFPISMNLPQGLLMAFSFWFPPLLLFLIPYFFKRSIKQLNPILA